MISWVATPVKKITSSSRHLVSNVLPTTTPFTPQTLYKRRRAGIATRPAPGINGWECAPLKRPGRILDLKEGALAGNLKPGSTRPIHRKYHTRHPNSITTGPTGSTGHPTLINDCNGGAPKTTLVGYILP